MVSTTPVEGGTYFTHSSSDLEYWMGVPQIDTDDMRGRGYGPHARRKRRNECPAGLVQTTPAKGGTDPTHSSSVDF